MDRRFDPTRTEWVVRDGPVRCIRLRDRFCGASTYVTETPGGLFINGDMAIGTTRGCGTFDAKTLGWLRTARGDYLYARFLETSWTTDRFLRGVREALDDDPEEWGLDSDALRAILFNVWIDEADAYGAWCDAGGDYESFPGMGFNVHDVALLDEIAEIITDFLATLETT